MLTPSVLPKKLNRGLRRLLGLNPLNPCNPRLFLFLMVLLPTAFAQQQQPFTIKVDTQLVVETVVVKDKDGKNIEGLTDKDFAVTEDGMPQTISVFEFQRLDETPASASPAGAVQPPAEVVQPKIPTQITAPPPGDSRYRDRRLIVLFFDLMNVSPPRAALMSCRTSPTIRRRCSGCFRS
jgi:hypothetical protein